MKNIWLNILAFVAFLAIEITAVSFMSTYPSAPPRWRCWVCLRS